MLKWTQLKSIVLRIRPLNLVVMDDIVRRSTGHLDLQNCLYASIIFSIYYTVNGRSVLILDVVLNVIINTAAYNLRYKIMITLLKIAFIATVVVLGILIFIAVLDLQPEYDVEEVFNFPDTSEEDSDSSTDQWHEGMQFDDDSTLSKDSGIDDDYQDAC